MNNIVRFLISISLLLLGCVFVPEASRASVNADALRGKTIVSWGSSVCDGWGASERGWMWQLEDALIQQGAVVLHRSTPGHKTEDKETQSERQKISGADYVIVCLSLGNQGLDQAATESDAYGLVQWYLEDLYYDEDTNDGDPVSLVNYIRSLGAEPIVTLAYPKANYNPMQCRQLVDANIYQQQLGVPVINHFSATNAGHNFDDLDCRWASGIGLQLNAENDPSHPNQLGHDEMFYAIPLDLFAAIAAGKKAPYRLPTQQPYRHQFSDQRLIYQPAYTMHNFTVQFEIMVGSDTQAVLASIEAQGVKAIDLRLENGSLQLLSQSGDLLGQSDQAWPPQTWQVLTLTYSYVRQTLELFLNGNKVTGVDTQVFPGLGQFFPTRFLLGGGRDRQSTLPSALLRQLIVQRAALHASEVKLQAKGSWLASASLDLYAPLEDKSPLINQAQSFQSLGLAPYESINPLGRQLFLRGDMNQWQPSSPMQYEGDGLYSTTVYIEAGTIDCKVADKAWQPTSNFGAGSGSEPLMADTWAELVSPSQQNISIVIPKSGWYKFEFQLDLASLTQSSLRFFKALKPSGAI